MKKMFLAIALILAAALAFTACGRNNDDDNDGNNQQTPAVTQAPADTTQAPGDDNQTPAETQPPADPIRLTYAVARPDRLTQQHALDAMNAALLERGFILEFDLFDGAMYQVMLAGMEADLVAAARWNDFIPNAQQGAFAPIDRELIRTLMPTWYENHAGFLEAATVDGQIFAIPNNFVGINAPYWMLRRDWFPPGLTSIQSMDDLYAYLAHARTINPHMIPIAMSTAQVNWQMAALGFAQTHVFAPGTPRSVSAIAMDKRDYPNFVMHYTYEMEEYVEFLRWMTRFYDSGFFHSDILTNPFPWQEAFFAGESAVFAGTNHDWVNWIGRELEAADPNAELYLLDFGAVFNVYADHTSAMGQGMTIPSRSADSVPDVLRLIYAFYTDQALQDLWRYGVEGVDHIHHADGRFEILDPDGMDMPIAFAPIYENVFHNRVLVTQNPQYIEFRDQARARGWVNPFVEFVFDMSDPANAALRNNLHATTLEHLPMISIGMTNGDADAAIARLMEALLANGLEEYREENVRQMNAFAQERGLNITVSLP
ncbi:MAG: hypothetical protein FWC71_03570 [Defluviitaleaceae bacterium]|nr:hypothetical protein [Defluviitaleaceae bacterium]